MDIIRIVVISMVLACLNGCMSAAVTGAQTVYNRHSIQKSINDQVITMKVYKALYVDSKQFQDTNISISTYQRDVLLAGQAPNQWQRDLAEKKVKNIPDIKRVYNFIELSNPTSTLIRISDAWITTKVKAKMIASEDVDPTKIKVVTENGMVFLMGTLKPSVADEAVKLASETEGVEKVVKIFSYYKIVKKI